MLKIADHGEKAAYLLVAVLVVVVYHGVLGGGFVFDDAHYVVGHPQVSGGLGGEAGWKWLFSSTEANLWHPLTWFSHALDVSLFGLNPGLHHLQNLLLHLGCGLLVFNILLRLAGGKVGMALLVTALWVVHCQHVEPVAWISARKGLLGAFFMLAAVAVYLRAVALGRQARPGSIALLVILQILALASHPGAVMLPAFLFCASLAYGGEWRGRLRLIPVAAVIPASLLMILATVAVQSSGGHSYLSSEMPPIVRLLISFEATGFYHQSILHPLPSSIFHEYPRSIALMPAILKALAGLASVCLVAWFCRPIRQLAVAGLGWWLLGLLPFLGFVPVGLFVADRYTYLPHVGIAILLLAVLTSLGQKIPVSWRRCSVIMLWLLVGLMGWQSHKRVGDFQNDLTLFSAEVKNYPDSYMGWLNLGVELGKTNEGTSRAIEAYERAIRNNPKGYLAHVNLGLCLERMGQAERAREIYLRARAFRQMDDRLEKRLQALGEIQR